MDIISTILVCAGVLGALLDVLLHILQLHDIIFMRWLQGHTAWITLLSAILIGVSLIAQFNAGAFVMDAFIAILALTSIVKGEPAHS